MGHNPSTSGDLSSWQSVQNHDSLMESLTRHRDRARAALVLQDGAPGEYASSEHQFRAQWFKQPLDHFDKARSETFLQRYWVSDRHYQSGGPVIVLDGGETSGENRLPFLDTGIVDILAKATHGLGVVLEHRYYGRSLPVLNFTTDALRFLNNNQSAADSANFMANVKFDEIKDDLTSPGTPWIYYGVSHSRIHFLPYVSLTGRVGRAHTPARVPPICACCTLT